MYAVVERIMTLFPSKPEPPKCIYEERIKCFEKLAQLQKNLQAVDKKYVNIAITEGKAPPYAQDVMEHSTKEYRKEYEICEKIMKY